MAYNTVLGFRIHVIIINLTVTTESRRWGGEKNRWGNVACMSLKKLVVANLLSLKYSCRCRESWRLKFVALLLAAKALIHCCFVVIAQRKYCCVPSSDKMCMQLPYNLKFTIHQKRFLASPLGKITHYLYGWNFQESDIYFPNFWILFIS